MNTRLKSLLAYTFASYLQYFPVKKWKKAISARVGWYMEGIPLKTAYGFPIYTRFHDRTNRMGFQGKLGKVPAFVSEVPQGACFIDIGANIGVITIMAARRVGADGCVLAFEPAAGTFAELQRNVALNRLTNVQLFPIAVAAAPSAVRLTAPDPIHSGAAHIEPAGTGDIEARPLDAIPEVMAAAATMPVYAKLDTEGYELEVLKGMRELLARRLIVALIVEIEPRHLARFGTSAEAVYAELAQFGYRPRLHATPATSHYDEIFDRTGDATGAA